MASLKEVGRVLAFLSTIHPEREITVDTMKAYHVVLSDLEAEVLMAVAVHLASTSKWLPKPSEMRTAALELLARSRGEEKPTAEQAWLEVMARMHSHGHVRLPEWSDELVGLAVEAIGGWRTVCLSTNTVADRAHFINVYNRLYARARDRAIEHPAITAAIESLAAGRALPPGPIARLMSGD